MRSKQNARSIFGVCTKLNLYLFHAITKQGTDQNKGVTEMKLFLNPCIGPLNLIFSFLDCQQIYKHEYNRKSKIWLD